MSLDDPGAQLHFELRAAVQAALATRRPLLHHLNADTSWFLQLPRPESAVRNGGRFYYNILLDPWLQGGQSDLASWFSQQWHVTPSAVGSIAELEELARAIEILAAGLRLGAGRKSNAAVEAEEEVVQTSVDAVAISHEFTDHCHRETLLEVHPDVPVFAVKEAAKLIEGWKHFRTVVTVNVFGKEGDSDWRGTSMPPLPDWVGISRLLQQRDVLNYHSALMITFNNKHGDSAAKLHQPGLPITGTPKRHRSIKPSEDVDVAEAIVYSPHGIHSGDLQLIARASPQIRTLAFLHGLHNVWVGTASGRTALQSNLGAHHGLKAQRILNAKYWIGTHDEVKRGGGLVSWFLQRDAITLKDALEQEQQNRKVEHINGELGEVLDSFEDVRWLELGNGESRVLV